MGLNPKIEAFLKEVNAQPIPLESVSPEQFRNQARMQDDESKQEVAKVEDRQIELNDRKLPIRIYRSKNKTQPALVFYHGGGWVVGSIDSHDATCREIANLADCTVISVDYRLAPEHKFPAAVGDAYDSFQWIAANADQLGIEQDKIAVGGDSAGGNLATVVCLLAEERSGLKPVFQLLLYPSTGYIGEEPASLQENAEGYLLTKRLMNWFRSHYYRTEADRSHPYASPVHSEFLHTLPPAAILTAEYDPLRDEAQAYAERLKREGVDVFVKNYEGLIHGFAGFTAEVEEAYQAVAEGAAQLREALYK
ncbi:alpha/beta hydrolase [Terribacillus saccharophilus]|uniref:alpha/beta hydrolase n=1 Tax=Terribacillus saccharophilus TaxID=361277 RepID=UPI000BA68894|nr:alpha/beta hydrolase [Terribacillus saccharophilus]PAF19048.1 alpha/beta hydrolase [Terribacillus saccharophilus]